MGAVDVASREVTVEASPKRLSTMGIKTVVAGAVGEGLEIYDFLVFSFFDVYISRAFFPQQAATQSLLLAVATLGLGFVTRPLGAFCLGMYADRFGRKKVLTLTIWLMGGATAAIAVLPSYDQIGVAAQICLVAARLVQGFASGGEVGSAALLMMEAAPPERRGIAMSWQITSHSLSYIASGIVGSLLAYKGVISAAFLKDATDPQWNEDPGIVRYRYFLSKYMPDSNRSDAVLATGYTTAQAIELVLRRCGDNLTRDNVMKIGREL